MTTVLPEALAHEQLIRAVNVSSPSIPDDKYFPHHKGFKLKYSKLCQNHKTHHKNIPKKGSYLSLSRHEKTGSRSALRQTYARYGKIHILKKMSRWEVNSDFLPQKTCAAKIVVPVFNSTFWKREHTAALLCAIFKMPNSFHQNNLQDHQPSRPVLVFFNVALT